MFWESVMCDKVQVCCWRS